MKNDKTYKKLEENWKKMEEGIMPPTLAFNTGSKLANANAGVNPKNDDLLAVTKFIDTFGREPKTNNDDWIEVEKMIPKVYNTDDFDSERFAHRAKQAILNYWKNKRL
jgi:hypothetical protein